MLKETDIKSDQFNTHNMCLGYEIIKYVLTTVLAAKSDSYIMFCLQSYRGLVIDRSLVY